MSIRRRAARMAEDPTGVMRNLAPLFQRREAILAASMAGETAADIADDVNRATGASWTADEIEEFITGQAA